MEICNAEDTSSLTENHISDFVYAPPGANIFVCQQTYKIKRGVDDTIQRFKGCSVAQVFNQKYGRVYNEIFPPVVRQTTFRILLSVSAARRINVTHIDIKCHIYLNGFLKEMVYMKPPPGFVDDNGNSVACPPERL